MNSRPLQACTINATDYTALIPGYFLIGRPLLALPEPEMPDALLNRMSRWKVIQSLQQRFWKQWTNEYLVSLQQRPKWRQLQTNLEVGDLVILLERDIMSIYIRTSY